MKTGLTLGKFAPFHKGHEYLIAHACEQVDRLYVMVYASDELPNISLATKVSWIQNRFPHVHIIQAPNGPKQTGYTDEIKRIQEQYILERLKGISIDVFFSSEPYSDHVSQALNAQGVILDINRDVVPISASQIRQDPIKYKAFMNKQVYQSLIKKVVFMGAPSTGKTTILLAAAKHFNTRYVLEYGREYWEKNNIDRVLTPEQLLFIAQEQIRQEDAALEHCDEFLFVDTNALTTWHFAQDYHSSALPELSMLADESKVRFDYVFLCGDEIPYEDTWERSGDVKRHEFQSFITHELESRGIAFTYLAGSIEERLNTIVSVLKT